MILSKTIQFRIVLFSIIINIFATCNNSKNTEFIKFSNIKNKNNPPFILFITPALEPLETTLFNLKISTYLSDNSPFALTYDLLNFKNHQVIAGKQLFKGHKISYENVKPLSPSKLFKMDPDNLIFIAPGKGSVFSKKFNIFYPPKREKRFRSKIFNIKDGITIYLSAKTNKAGIKIKIKTKKNKNHQILFIFPTKIIILQKGGKGKIVNQIKITENQSFTGFIHYKNQILSISLILIKTGNTQAQYYLSVSTNKLLGKPDFYGLKKGFLDNNLFTQQIIWALRHKFHLILNKRKNINILYLPEIYYLKKYLTFRSSLEQIKQSTNQLLSEFQEFIKLFKNNMVSNNLCIAFAGTNNVKPITRRFDFENYLQDPDIFIISYEGEVLFYNVNQYQISKIIKKISKLLKKQDYTKKDFQFKDFHSFLKLNLPVGTENGKCKNNKNECKVFYYGGLAFYQSKKRWIGYNLECPALIPFNLIEHRKK